MKRFFKYSTSFLLILVSNLALAENNTPIQFNTDFSNQMMGLQTDSVNKPIVLLNNVQSGNIKANTINISGTFWGSIINEHSNTAGKFPILSRLPSQHGSTSKDATDAVTNLAAIGVTANLFNTGFVYLQPEYTDVEYPGQDDVQMRKVYLMIGNLEKSPFYGVIGKNSVDFGWMDSYNPLTHTVNNHYFRTESEDYQQLVLGYKNDNVELSGTLIPSGRQLRVADSDDTQRVWDNGAVNGRYTINLNEEKSNFFKIGAGYLNSTIYNRGIANHPGASFQALSKDNLLDYRRNPAYDINGEFKFGGFKLGAEYTTTSKDWPATKKEVSAWTVQSAYTMDIFTAPTTFSAVYSRGQQGPNGTEYEDAQQHVLGVEIQINPYAALTFEYVYNKSFVPLIGITDVSDKDVQTDTFIFGVKLGF